MEFQPRGSFPPIRNMMGGGPFGLEPGQWTDDTSMALCLATSLVESGGFRAADQMERYCRWAEEGYLSSTGQCFDIGRTVDAALRRYRTSGDPWAGSTDRESAGNGSIMRLAPVVMFFFPDLKKVSHFAVESSRTTHGTAECLDACRLLAGILFRAVEGRGKNDVLFEESQQFDGEARIEAIARGEYVSKTEKDISGSGYVVSSLEAALWCFFHSNSFDEAVLAAVSLGDDADTTAAVCGQVAGAYYGVQGIPEKWQSQLAMRDQITTLADDLYYARDG